MKCGYRDVLVDYIGCRDVAEFMVQQAPVGLASGMFYFDAAVPMCESHMNLAATKAGTCVVDMDDNRVERDWKPVSGQRRSCHVGHVAVGWRGDDPCFVCGGPGEDRDIYSLSHADYYGDPVLRWRVEEGAA